MTLEYEDITEATQVQLFKCTIFSAMALRESLSRSITGWIVTPGIFCGNRTSVKVKFKGVIVGEYEANLLVDEKVNVELKVAKGYNSKDEPQLLNELTFSLHFEAKS